MKEIPLFKVFMSPSASQEVVKVLESGYIGEGPKVKLFEEKLSETLGTDLLLTTNSCTSALSLALRLIGTTDAQFVISTPLTCAATNWPILMSGDFIQWADVDPKTCNIFIPDVVNKVNVNTKAIMVVHWGGYPVDVDELATLVVQKLGYCPPIIEDCAHAMGATYKDGTKVGTSGNYCAFSLQAIKHITSIDGGVLVLPNTDQYDRAKLLRWYGIDRSERGRTDFRCEIDVPEWGYKFHMNDVCAAVGIENLKHLDDILEKYRSNAEYYNRELKGTWCDLPVTPEGSNPAYWLYTIRVDRKDDFIIAMKEAGIVASKVHERNDVHICVQQFKNTLPLLDSFNDDFVCIPVGWWVTKEDREHIVDTIKKGW